MLIEQKLHSLFSFVVQLHHYMWDNKLHQDSGNMDSIKPPPLAV